MAWWVVQLAGHPTENVVWQLLHAIERSILPRSIELITPAGWVRIDAANGRMLLCPRLNGVYCSDDELREEGPHIWRYLSTGGTAHSSDLGTLLSEQDALRRQCGRALASFTETGSNAQCSIKALRAREFVLQRLQLPSFSALELARALGANLFGTANGMVVEYYRLLAPEIRDAWLFERTGRPLGFPADVVAMDEIRTAAMAVRSALSWRQSAEPQEGKLLAVGTLGEREGGVRGLAIDTHHIAFMSGPVTQSGAIISAWRRVFSNAGTRRGEASSCEPMGA